MIISTRFARLLLRNLLKQWWYLSGFNCGYICRFLIYQSLCSSLFLLKWVRLIRKTIIIKCSLITGSFGVSSALWSKYKVVLFFSVKGWALLKVICTRGHSVATYKALDLVFGVLVNYLSLVCNVNEIVWFSFVFCYLIVVVFLKGSFTAVNYVLRLKLSFFQSNL